MLSVIRRKLSMAQRALDFVSAHPVTDTSFETVAKSLEAVVARANALGMQQSDGAHGEHAALARRASLRRRIRREHLVRLVRIAAMAEKTHPEIAGQFVMPRSHVPNKVFVLAARSMLAAAVGLKDILTPLGLGNSFIENATSTLDQFESMGELAGTGRTRHVGASAELRGLMREITTLVDVIGTYYLAEFPNDLELLAGWESARNVVGPFRRADASAPPAAAGDVDKAA
jgi:hypothetical protein